MSVRTDLQPENELPKTVTNLRAEVDNIKINQRVGGSGMVTYWNRNTGPNDWTWSLSGGQSGYHVVTFTATQQENPFGRLQYQLFYSTASNEIHPNDPHWPNCTILPQWSDPANPKAIQWKFQLTEPTGSPGQYWAKWWIHASDLGNIS